MKKLINKNFWQETIIATIFLFSVEIIFRVISSFSVINWATLRIFFSSFCLALILEIMLSFIKKRYLRERIMGFIIFVVSCYSWAQLGLRNFLGVYISMGTSSQLGAVTSYINEFLASTHFDFYLVFVPFILYFIYLCTLKKWSKVEGKINWGARISGFIVLVLTSLIYAGTLFIGFMQNPIQSVSNAALIYSPTNSSIAINQFGTTMFGILDFKQLLFPQHIIISNFDKIIEEEDEYSRVFDDTLWKEIESEENDPMKKSISQYFLSRSISPVNDYTGYFEEKNLIVIMMESVNNTILNSEYFPNFSRILEHSWYWENNYSPRNSCATGDNEFSGMTSIYALNSSCTANVYQNNTYSTSIFNRFRDAGYKTSSYHNLDSTYYSRDVFHLNMGSENYYDGNRLGIEFDSANYSEWPSDVELMEKASAIFTQDSPFMAWITTVSAHQPYDGPSTLGDKYLSLFDHTNYPLTLKRYLSKTKVTDDALGVLLDLLEAKNILHDTVIVLYGDHYPYGLSDSDVQSVVDYDIGDFNERERVPFAIYNAELESKVFNEKTSYMNILPTLANLFNLDYDPRLYFGEDLFSDNYSNRVIFADSSWEDSVARYNASSGTVTYFGEEKYSNSELQTINNEIYQKKQMSRLAVTSNYFEYLKNKLMEKQTDLTKEEVECD